MDMDVQGSYRCACGVDTWFPCIAYRRPIDYELMMKISHRQGGASITCSWPTERPRSPRRGLEAHKEAETHT